ncbi:MULTISPECIES: aminotransferase class I/II-fold pyridoxal phosphate-dependent enzyme [unclassified Enterococcus]|uniref:aminotransferase class I/II-fold pyridoxal phosphate-dependent enzyme n=1 Tax=unclassified Enterococcus TaxID=2608891 RepID=UPI001552F768|nr:MULTISPECIES: aminotransferase class I/II-fold pyridoxal phosphate-dependent enzyme [unclassified Enterococcus]MBS7578333.1 aminotransferase class I/II-fold pyridoxal phosphate-dependent enzyme [Enterococcus sp. MMGLQ5-2]MBS7585570.1 aminotransferase class I/II-fold pyridoxal phosphate-dependent enzyme [Enterococcus sp. MMGLQ5-1]NPD13429.1 aminotransferase class I/II-fold pyridoxal phosphate-dependent enzyme [Enterococcus sp. MMGLQ5-1]NPD38164.1 aminotransferase class I/II-fold pyridoxal pho
MHIANRVLTLPQNKFERIDDKIAKLLKSGAKDLINLGKGNPDGRTPDFIIDALHQSVEIKENQGYTAFSGKQSALKAIAKFYLDNYQVELDPETEIIAVHGAVVGLVATINSLIDPGQKVVVSDPYYPTYEAATHLAEGDFTPIKVAAENNFLLKVDEIPADTDLLLLNYPSNPTGAIAPKKYFSDIITAAQSDNFSVVHDFAYSNIGFEAQQCSFLQASGAKEVGVEIFSTSKVYNMAGWRFGFVAGNAEIIAAIKRYHAQYYSMIFGAVSDAAVSALLSNQAFPKQQLELYRKRLNIYQAGFEKLGVEMNVPKGALYVWQPVPKGYTSEEFADLLLSEAHVAVMPGNFFGEGGEGYIRLSLMVSDDEIAAAMHRFAAKDLFKAKSLA